MLYSPVISSLLWLSDAEIFLFSIEISSFYILLGIGYASLATNCFLALYYNVLIAYCFYYLIASFQLVVPWSTCGNWWNTALCTDQRTLANLSRTDLALMKSNLVFLCDYFQCICLDMTSSPSEEYF